MNSTTTDASCNGSQRVSTMLTICFAPHLFGSGKTTFCSQLPEIGAEFQVKENFFGKPKERCPSLCGFIKVEPMIPFEEKGILNGLFTIC
eukprot:jgi/Galph1/1592/GphlegSOOS_G298.1